MQFEEAERRRSHWGTKPCEHPDIAAERFRSTTTGDFRCTVCGATFDRSERDRLEAERRKEGQS